MSGLKRKGVVDAPVEGRGNVGDHAQKFDNQGESILRKVFFGSKPTQDSKYKRSVR